MRGIGSRITDGIYVLAIDILHSTIGSLGNYGKYPHRFSRRMDVSYFIRFKELDEILSIFRVRRRIDKSIRTEKRLDIRLGNGFAGIETIAEEVPARIADCAPKLV